MAKQSTVTDKKRAARRPLVLNSATKQEAQMERLIVSRMNALVKLLGGTVRRNENTISLVVASKHVEIQYVTYAHNGELLYDLVLRDTLTDHRMVHVEYVFDHGNEVIPLSDHSSVVFSNARNQAEVFAESLVEFIRQVTSAARAYTEALEHAKQLLPRGA